ncbi:MAG: hypothetical protein A2945_05345 [Candidatus Liptonbacteria bacterium RIFCSPLOWO2_01_FULL_52_25]|uniref:Uncharacterized protein n=1 Tax=Candidatus Liptonbacteria bacterium RIFCSPLOWO2_01_FULL_52_25 TaxID=1798650 RepID=A0A1G2CCJ6_9BACT|nr:MAG: hypothetical protein A2945_05345 [Candidatus Liptonbacteria bacterium RIFCSPLOWO2_01_FULL_52_25]
MKKQTYKHKTPNDLSKRLKRRFYKIAAITTLVYVTLSLIKFHGELSYLPNELAITWAVFLLCYTSFKELLRWNNIEDAATYRGGLWAALVLGGGIWMIAWNIVRAWAFNLPSFPFPAEYQAVTIETIVLYTLSLISASLYKYRKGERYTMRQKARGRAMRQAKKDVVSAAPAQNTEIQAVLTKTTALDDKNNPPDEKTS